MKSFVRFVLSQTVFINVVFVILTVAGAFCLFTMPVENLPKVDIGKVFIHTNYFGAPAADVEQLVTREIEESLQDMDSVEYIQSSSYRNFSSVQVKFIDDTDYRDLYDELRFRTLNVKQKLPAGAEEPYFFYIDTDAWKPVIMVNVTGDLPQRSLKLVADELKSRILAIPDVRSAQLEGEVEKEFHVNLDPAALRRFNVTFGQVAKAIASANTKLPTGRFREDGIEFQLDAGERLSTQEQVLSIVVKREVDGHVVRVGDLTVSASLHNRDPFEVPSINGDNAIRMRVLKEKTGNALTIAKKVKEVAEQFAKAHADQGIGVVFNKDSTLEIRDSVNTLGGNLLMGMALVVVLLWITLGFRNAMLAAVGVPFSYLCCFVILRLNDVSLNNIVLFSFVLLSGILVDDATVIIENVYRHLQSGKDRRTAVVDGTAEVIVPVITSMLTTMLAFVPMLIMSGSTGEFFSFVPKTVAYALCASLLEAMFILPVHILDWGPRKLDGEAVDEDEDPYHHLRTGLFAPLWKAYQGLLAVLLRVKGLAILGAFGLFIFCMGILVVSILGIAPLIKVKFFPGNYFRYHVTVGMPVGTALEKTDAVVRDISRYIMSMGQAAAQSAEGTSGFYESEDYQHRTGNYYGQVVVTLPEVKTRNFPENPGNDPMQHLDYMRRKIREFVDRRYAQEPVKPVIRVFEEGDGPPSGKAVNVRVTAMTLEDAIAATNAIEDYMKKSPDLAEIRDLEDNRPDMQRAVRFIPDQEKIHEYGLATGDVVGLAAGALSGFRAGEFRSLDEEVDLVVRVARSSDTGNAAEIGLAAPTDVLAVPVVENAASPILLSDLITAEYFAEPNMRSRYNGRPTITVAADIKSGSKLSSARVRKLIEDYFNENRNRFPGVSLSYGGEFESTSRSYTSLSLAFLIAILCIYLVLASQFNDYFQPVIIISAVPFALIGVVLGLFITRTTFTIGSFMAVVGLAGVAVNNSILLIDFMNKRIARGRSLRDAVMESAAARLRPVFITTVTTLLGLLPMAIGIPHKSISWAPMATAFVSGLASSTALTLVMIPVEYEAFERLKRYMAEKAGAMRAGVRARIRR
ncbi:MAG: efflux RND transporter permease subunit [Thermodesulfobacteriota bacterium]